MTATNAKLHEVLDEQISLNPDVKLVISRIAKLAGVSNATIHNRHPDVLERIAAHNAKFIQAKSTNKNAQIAKLKTEKKQLLSKVEELEAKVRKLVSIIATHQLKLPNNSDVGYD
jgi:seryl-tRNA synthetase